MGSLDLELYKLLEKEFGDLLEQLAAEIVSGRASDYSDYRFRCGKINAIKDALLIAKKANRKVLGLKDDEER